MSGYVCDRVRRASRWHPIRRDRHDPLATHVSAVRDRRQTPIAARIRSPPIHRRLSCVQPMAPSWSVSSGRVAMSSKRRILTPKCSRCGNASVDVATTAPLPNYRTPLTCSPSSNTSASTESAPEETTTPLARLRDRCVDVTMFIGPIAELAEQRDDIDTALLDAIRDARRADRSWSEIGAMLGVSKQAAQRKYASKISA